MNEEWRDIEGYEGLYQCSNLGRIKSLNYKCSGKEKILKQYLGTDGYLHLQLCKNKNNHKLVSVHRLVANAFLENPNNLPCVNHKDEDKTNNVVNNLEFCSVKYNVNYGTATKRRAEKTSTPIKCLDLEKNETIYFPSISEASRQLNIQKCSIQQSIYKWNTPYKKRYIFSEIIDK